MPSFATQVFPEFPYLRTQRSSCIELALYSERTRAEHQADFHRHLCARLGDVAQQQRDYQRRLKIRAEAGLSPRFEHLARARYIDAEDTPLTPSRVELVDDAVDGDEDDELLHRSAEAVERESNREVP